MGARGLGWSFATNADSGLAAATCLVSTRRRSGAHRRRACRRVVARARVSAARLPERQIWRSSDCQVIVAWPCVIPTTSETVIGSWKPLSVSWPIVLVSHRGDTRREREGRSRSVLMSLGRTGALRGWPQFRAACSRNGRRTDYAEGGVPVCDADAVAKVVSEVVPSRQNPAISSRTPRAILTAASGSLARHGIIEVGHDPSPAK